MANMRVGYNTKITFGDETLDFSNLRIDVERIGAELRPIRPRLLLFEYTTIAVVDAWNKRLVRRLGYLAHFHRKHSRGVRRKSATH